MPRITLSASALAAALNADLYRRGVPAFVRVDQVVRAPAGEGVDGADWVFGLERSLVPLDDDATAERYATALFTWEDEVDAAARWAAQRFAIAWDEDAPREAVFIPAPEPAAHPARRGRPVGARKAAGGE
ncbi:MAG TPA: hypothetical protein VGC13_29305 [Longimicrobium sp.]|jgi:hypothetical protein|uniref:hypothetical protein n=1 Tax=Longimicrobium sp. TaxID=2029185 RepID=UPI002EDAE33B